jgi:tetratricopeptide (TPR) repeat protein
MGDDGCSPTSQVTSWSAGRGAGASVGDAVSNPVVAAAGGKGSGAVAGGQEGTCDAGAETCHRLDADMGNKSGDVTMPPGTAAARVAAHSVGDTVRSVGDTLRTPGCVEGEASGNAWVRGEAGSVGGGGAGGKSGGRLALMAYQKALDADPANVEIAFKFGSYLQFTREDPLEAQALYAHALAHDPAHIASAINIARCLVETSAEGREGAEARRGGRTAEEWYQLVIELQPWNIDGLVGKAQALLQAHRSSPGDDLDRVADRVAARLEEARQLFARALTADKELYVRQQRRQPYKVGRGQLDVSHLSTMAALLEDLADVYASAAIRDAAGHDRGEGWKAASAGGGGVGGGGDRGGARGEDPRVGQLLGEAADMYERALGIEPRHVPALYNLALLRDSRLEEAEAAAALYRRVLVLQPEHFGTLCNLGALLESHFADYHGARSLYEQALKLEPTDSATLFNYAGLLETILQCIFTRRAGHAPADGKGGVGDGADEAASAEADEAELARKALYLYQSAVESNPAHVPSHLALARLTSPYHLNSYTLLVSAKVSRRYLQFVHHAALDRVSLLLGLQDRQQGQVGYDSLGLPWRERERARERERSEEKEEKEERDREQLAGGVHVRAPGAMAARLASWGGSEEQLGGEGGGGGEAGEGGEGRDNRNTTRNYDNAAFPSSKVVHGVESAWGAGHAGQGAGLRAAQLDMGLLVQFGDMLWDRDPGGEHGPRDAFTVYAHVLALQPSHAHALIASACILLHEVCILLHHGALTEGWDGVMVGDGFGGWGGERGWGGCLNRVGAPSECLLLVLSAVAPPVGLGMDGYTLLSRPSFAGGLLGGFAHPHSSGEAFDWGTCPPLAPPFLDMSMSRTGHNLAVSPSEGGRRDGVEDRKKPTRTGGLEELKEVEEGWGGRAKEGWGGGIEGVGKMVGEASCLLLRAMECLGRRGGEEEWKEEEEAVDEGTSADRHLLLMKARGLHLICVLLRGSSPVLGEGERRVWGRDGGEGSDGGRGELGEVDAGSCGEMEDAETFLRALEAEEVEGRGKGGTADHLHIWARLELAGLLERREDQASARGVGVETMKLNPGGGGGGVEGVGREWLRLLGKCHRSVGEGESG